MGIDILFLQFLRMSLTASYVILAVLFIRLLLSRVPKKYSYLLWSVVGFRLICPVSFESFFSLFNLKISQGSKVAVNLAEVPAAQHVVNTVNEVVWEHEANTGIPAINYAIQKTSLFQQSPYSMNLIQHVLLIGGIVWILGVSVLMLYQIYSYWKMKKRVNFAVRKKENIFELDQIRSPFILGYLKPRIYIPYGLEKDRLTYVIAHERYHLKRKDHIVKLMASSILILHWFNPLVWLSYYLMCRDMEMSCDEKILAENDGIKKGYSMTLLSFASNTRNPITLSLSFGETSVKRRIKNVLNFKRPKTYITILAMILCVAVVTACAANPVTKSEISETETSENNNVTETVADVQNGETETVIVDDELEQAIDVALIQYCEDMNGKAIDQTYYATSFVVSSTETMASADDANDVEQISVNGSALYEILKFQKSCLTLEEENTDQALLSITFDVDENHDYILKSIQEFKWEELDEEQQPMFDETYTAKIKEQIQECYLKAIEYGISENIFDPDQAIEEKLLTILSSPAESSNPWNYIQKHQDEYGELCNYSIYTLSYCFKEFYKGGQDDLRGYVMSQLCKDILPDMNETAADDDLDGQAWFESYYEKAKKNAQYYDLDVMKLKLPGSWLIYQMDEAGMNKADAGLGKRIDMSSFILAKVYFDNGQSSVKLNMTEEHLSTIKKMFDGYGYTNVEPDVTFEEYGQGCCIKFDNDNYFDIATDDSGYIHWNGRYFKLSEEDNQKFMEILNQYGYHLVFGC